MSTETFQTQYPDGLTVHLDSDCLLAIERALGTLDDFFDTTFKFFAEDAIRSILGAIKEAEQSRAYDNYVTARANHSAISTPIRAASPSGRFYCRTCDDILPTHVHGLEL